MNAILTIDNQTARRFWLHCQGLGRVPSGDATHAALLSTVEKLGMVQLDPLAPVARAHHHILWTRHSAYRPKHYDTLLERQRQVFEHFTHDAAILPMSLWPCWERARQRRAERHARGDFWQSSRAAPLTQAVLDRIRLDGPVCSRDFDLQATGKADKSVHAWARPPHKQVLEQLWFQGTLVVSHRRRFHKYYDLAERVIPAKWLNARMDEVAQTDKLCTLALQRLGMATTGELQRFWDTCTRKEVLDWVDQHRERWIPVRVEDARGEWHDAIAPENVESQLADLVEPPPRVRVLNPFDPLVRDRARLERLFGFSFRIEIYVPAHKRQYGYYVFPVLEAKRFIGRIEVRANRENDRLQVIGWWPEPGLRPSRARIERIDAELGRLCRLAGVSSTDSIDTLV